jgi:NAD(P)-dependent dehydrogenase (short-subunit alcohol dehydrogenase family)
MGLMTGKVALVTGAGSGIGRASALAFAREGARVVVSDLDVDGGEETIAAINEISGEAIFVRTDVTREDEVEAMVARTVQAFGRMDCAHNNAGITGAGGSIADYPLVEWERTMAVNLTSVFLCMKHEIPYLLEGGGGAIVNTSSGAGLVGFPGLPAYVASKHGVVGLTRAVALEYATQGIRVNAVCPGSTRTPMLEAFMGGDPAVEKAMARSSPVERLAAPEEIAEAVVWLCSDAASFVTGHPMAVDGGAVAR